LLAEALALPAAEVTGTACVVTTVVVIAGIVEAALVVPETVLGCAVDISVEVVRPVVTVAVVPICVETVLEIVTTLDNVVPGMVVGEIVVASTVLPGNVVVYVSVTNPPSAVAGTALPTPAAVNCGGRARVAVFGLAAPLLAYIFPTSPAANVYSPVNKFALSPLPEVYAPVATVPKLLSGRRKLVVNLS
jgi:hypothetical protein